MLTGITFGEWDLPEALALGVEVIRTDVPASGLLHDFVRPLVGAPLAMCFILHDVARNAPLLDAMRDTGYDTARALIEPFNEREQGRVTPQVMVEGVNAITRDCAARGFLGRIIASGDSALSTETVKFYRAIAPSLPSDCVIAFHDYPWKTQPEHRPWPLFPTHEASIEAFLDAIGAHVGACGEFGFHMAEEVETLGGDEVYRGRLSEDQVYACLIEYFRRYARYGLDHAIPYQWQDGPTDDAMGRFGIHTAHGQRKRQAAALLDWRHPMATNDPKGVVGETLLTGDVHQLVASQQKGKFNYVRLHDGAVLSLQQDGSQEYRDPGTDGPFERCEVDGNTLVYAYHFGGQDYIHTVAAKVWAGEFAS